MTKARTNADNVTADIAGITAGTGITGGGTSGTVTITNDMATTIAAAGDLIYGTANDAYTRLGLGTAGQLLKVNSSATAPEWGAAPSTGANFTLLNSGGTSLTAATTITVSGISGANDIFLYFDDVSTVNASAGIRLRLNTDSTSKYKYAGLYVTPTILFGTSQATLQTSWFIGQTGNNESNNVFPVVSIRGCNSGGVKVMSAISYGTYGATGQEGGVFQGFYEGTSSITSVSVISESGNFDSGKIYVYTSA